MVNDIKHFKMRLSTYKKIRRLVPGVHNETTADYFDRVANYFKNMEDNALIFPLMGGMGWP